MWKRLFSRYRVNSSQRGSVADTSKSPAQRFEHLQKVVQGQRTLLTEDQGIAGTALSAFSLLRLSSDYDNFREECLRQLGRSPTCTGAFNISGKRLDVEVSFAPTPAADQVVIGITNTENPTARRKVVFKAE